MAQDDTTRSQRRNRRQFIKAAGMTLSTTLLHPESRGRITLTSSDPFDELLINPNYLDEQPEPSGISQSSRIWLWITIRGVIIERFTRYRFQPNCVNHLVD